MDDDAERADTARREEIAALRALLAEMDVKTWNPDIAAARARMDVFGEALPMPDGWTAEPINLGRPADRFSGPLGWDDRVILYLHGGGYCLGSPKSHRGLIAQLARACGASAVALDYRLAPEHPFPAAIEDATEAYRLLLKQGFPESAIVFMGDSAGGGLAVATALRAKQIGLPQPCALVLLSPWVDLSQGGETMTALAVRDPMLDQTHLDEYARLYLAGHDANDPLASPIRADLAGLAQMLIHVGGEEVLLSDSERLKAAARAAGVEATMEIWPEMIHVWHFFHPMLSDAREAIDEIGAWMSRRWG